MSFEATMTRTGLESGDLGAIRRILQTTAVLAGMLVIVLWAYLGWAWAAGLAGGTLVGALNLVFLTLLITEILRPGRRLKGRIIALLAVKMPLVYGGLAGLLLWKALPMVAIVLGFSLVLAVIVLKAAGRALLSSGLLAPGGRPAQRG